MKPVLFVRPSYDDVTAYLFFYSKELVKMAMNKGFLTLNREKTNASKEVVIGIIQKKDPDFIMFNGHGNPDSICGHNDEIIINRGDNHSLLKNRMVYSLSCSSAAGIGMEVADGQTTFIGYLEDFGVGMDTRCQASIGQDDRARMFLEPSNLLVQSILKGNSAWQAAEKSKELMKKNLSLLRTDPAPDAKDYIPYLFNNYIALTVLGNTQASLSL